jgi:hypothetical protein
MGRIVLLVGLLLVGANLLVGQQGKDLLAVLGLRPLDTSRPGASASAAPGSFSPALPPGLTDRLAPSGQAPVQAPNLGPQVPRAE